MSEQNDIVNDIADIVSRVGGLESEQVKPTTISRIVKVYNFLGVKVNIKVKKTRALFPGSDVYPSTALYFGGNTVLTRDNTP